MSKKSIESRVLQVFEWGTGIWLNAVDVRKHGSTSDLSPVQVSAACVRLHRRGKLQLRSAVPGALVEYRLNPLIPRECIVKKPAKERKMSKDVPTFGSVIAAIVGYYRSALPGATMSVVGCHENVLPARLKNVDRRQVEEAFDWLLKEGAVTGGLTDFTPDVCYQFVPGFQFGPKVEAELALGKTPELTAPEEKAASEPTELEQAVLSVFSQEGHDWCAPAYILEEIHGPLHSMVATGDVQRACDRLVARGQVMQALNGGARYRVPERAEKLPTSAEPTVDPVAALVEACGGALYPGGNGSSLNAETLPARISQLVEDVKQYKELARTELKTRHDAEQRFTDERSRLEKALFEASNDHLAAENELGMWEAKFAALDACYRGLFGSGSKKGS
jgi:hypothetical protein